MLKQYSTGSAFKNDCKNSCHEHPEPYAVLGQALPQEMWGGGGGGGGPHF